jgi:hypothetical protein
MRHVFELQLRPAATLLGILLVCMHELQPGFSDLACGLLPAAAAAAAAAVHASMLLLMGTCQAQVEATDITGHLLSGDAASPACGCSACTAGLH